MPARFILSFDCEGKWGVADGLTPRHRRDFTDEKLRQAYTSILQILDEYEIAATFAFVGAFTQSPKEFARIRPELEALSRQASAYLVPALRDVDESRGDGWHGDHLVAAVAESRATHEIALHGVTHVPWTAVGVDFAEAEMRLFETLEGPVRNALTFVYPRNLVAHTKAIANHGFAGFRTAHRKRSRALSLLSEFNLFEAPEHVLPSGEPIPIPAGFFLNWRSGLRRLVPPAMTRMRARGLLDAAAANDAIVHYWLHPENVAGGPSTLGLLRMLAREVAQSREAGDCEVLTQLGYCRLAESLS